MDLFTNEQTETTNLLPKDGCVLYYGKIFSKQEADDFYERLLHHVAWKNDEAIIFGKHIVTARKVAWYGDADFKYQYSKIVKQALLWTDDLLILKKIVEERLHERFNSCLLNLYHNGNEGMAWHSDDEKDLKKNGAIASVSFGAERKFSFRHKQTKETVSLVLAHGSMLVMRGTTQSHWLHRLPPTKLVTQPRINLTFRTIVQ